MADEMSLSSGDDESPLFIVADSPSVNTKDSSSQCCSKQCLCILILSVVCIALSVSLIVVNVQNSYRKSICSQKNSKNLIIEDFLFFQLSDTHLDLNYKSNVIVTNLCRDVVRKGVSNYNVSQSITPYGKPGCDTPVQLLESVAKQMKDINIQYNKRIHFVLLSGDQMAHDYDDFEIDMSELIVWSIGNSTRIISETLGIPVITAIGNNDLPKDYKPPVTNASQFYEKLSAVLIPYIFPKNSVTARLNSLKLFKNDFNAGGYYSLNVTDDLMVVVVNSNYWAMKAFEINPEIKTYGEIHLKWFSNQLSFAKQINKKVIIVGHIPPGVSSYRAGGSFWLDEFLTQYVLLVTQYKQIIVGQLYGHLHQDKVKIQQVDEKFQSKPSQSDTSYVLICPSITPIYQNNPSFRLFTLDQNSKKFLDYAQYYMDLEISNYYQTPLWNLEYKFSHLYGAFGLESILNLVRNMVSKINSTWIPYSSHMKTLFGGVLSSERFIEHCVARYSQNTTYQKCMDDFKSIIG